MVDIKGISTFGKGFIVHYTISCPCGCKTTRRSLTMSQPKKPTEKQAKQAIQDETDNKR